MTHKTADPGGRVAAGAPPEERIAARASRTIVEGFH
jgi:hypothetical protein